MANDMNLGDISVGRFLTLVREKFQEHAYGAEANPLTPIMGLGKAGIGKTESIAALTKEMGIGYKELRLVTMMETDMLGVPYIEEVTDDSGKVVARFTDWASTKFFPIASKDGERGILVLDEITSASKNIRSAAYQLLDKSRALGNYNLPDGWLIVCLGNGPEDGGNFQGLEGAFLTRCAGYNLTYDVKEWKRWATTNSANATVLAFISYMPEYLHKFDPDAEVHLFPCPRGWTALSKKLNIREIITGGLLDAESIRVYANGAVGVDASAKFQAFYEYNSVLVNAEDILAGKVKADVNLATQVIHIICQSLTLSLKKEIETGKIDDFNYKPEVITVLANTINWVVDMGEGKMLDLAIMMVREFSSNINELTSIVLKPEFKKACPKYFEFLRKNNVAFS